MASQNRTVKTSLVLEATGYIANANKAAKATRELGSEAEKLAAKKDAINELGAGMLAIGAVAAVGIGIAVKRASDFDAAISAVKANTQETTQNMALLRDAALEFGASSVFTATESANAIEELGKAGISTADILGGGLASALDLAASSGLGIARAAEIAATTMQQFGLRGDEAGRVADTLAAGAGKALGSVDDLANGLKFVGPVAASMGVSLEETTGVLALFAQAGIVGEQGGTAFRGMLGSLTSPSKLAAAEIERLGINLYDAQGNFLGAENLAGELARTYTDLDDKSRDASLGILFGNEQVTAARVLFQEGAAGVSEMTKAVTDNGYAAQVAADRLDNLQGDVEKLGGAFDTALIRSGSGANEILRDITQSATFLVDAFGSAPQPVLDAGLAIGAVAAATTLAGGAALVAVPKYVAFKASLETLNVSGKKVAVTVGALGGALGIATAGISYFIGRQADIAATTDTLVGTLDEATGAMTEYTREAVAKKLSDEGLFKYAKIAGISQKDLTDAVLEGGDAYDTLMGKIGDLNTIGNINPFDENNAFAAGNAAGSIREIRTAVEDSGEAFQDLKAAGDDVTDTSSNVATGLSDVGAAASDATGEVATLSEAIQNFGATQFDVRAKTRDFEDAIDTATEALQENGANLDINTEAGRENQANLDAIAASANELAAAKFNETASVEETSAALARGREQYIETGIRMGLTREEATRYADALIATPDQVITEIKLTGMESARATLDGLVAEYGKKVIYLKTLPAPGGLGTGELLQRATGGILPGAPSSRDNMLLHAASGEFLTNARQTAVPENRAALEFINSGGNIANYSPTYVPATDRQYAPVSSSSSSKTINHTTNINGIGVSLPEAQQAAQFERNQTLRGL